MVDPASKLFDMYPAT